jgi:hypothetical protein
MSQGDDLQDRPGKATGKATLKQRISVLFDKYGRIAVVTYFALSILAIVGFSIGIGAEPSTATGVLGVLGAGWVAAKVTLPFRILITLGLTPVVAIVLTRLGRNATGAPPVDPQAPGGDPR